MCACVHACVRASVRACVRVYVCVCLSEHAILTVRAIRSITKKAIVLSVRFAVIIIQKAFFLKLSYSKVRKFFTHFGRDGHL